MDKYEARSRYLVGIISDELELSTKLTRSSWTKVTKLFNNKYPGGFSVSLLKHHFDRLELCCDILRTFECHPQFTLIEGLGCATANEAAWKEHLKLHPEAQLVQGIHFPLFETMKALNLEKPPGLKSARFNRELMKPNCDLKEVLEDYTTLISHNEMLSGVLVLDRNDEPPVTPTTTPHTSSSSTSSGISSPVTRSNRAKRGVLVLDHNDEPPVTPTTTLYTSSSSTSSGISFPVTRSKRAKPQSKQVHKKKRYTTNSHHFSFSEIALKLIEREGAERIASRVMRLRAPRVVRSEQASFVFLHLADDIRWGWLVDEAEDEKYDSRFTQDLTFNHSFSSFLSHMMLD